MKLRRSLRCHSGTAHRSRVYPRSASKLPKSATADLGGPGPESILPAGGYGFPAFAKASAAGRVPVEAPRAKTGGLAPLARPGMTRMVQYQRNAL